MRKENLRKAKKIFEIKYEKPREKREREKLIPNILSTKCMLNNRFDFPSLKQHKNPKKLENKGSLVSVGNEQQDEGHGDNSKLNISKELTRNVFGA